MAQPALPGFVGDGHSCTPLPVGARPSVGDSQASLIRGDAALWCWGRNSSGELGVGGALRRGAVTSDGSLWCWGQKVRGQLGALGHPALAVCP